MKGRYALLGGAVLALGLLNLWQWTAAPGGGARERPAAGAGGFRADEFQLRAGLAAADRLHSSRNLFQPRLPPAPPPAPVAVKQVEAPAPPPGPPPKTPEQVAEEAARDELRQIKLLGVVFRGGKGQAFLVKGDQAYMVHAGGRVGERFQVESINAESIQLNDPASRVNGQIPVSGK